MNWSLTHRALRPFSSSIFDQVVLSATNFLVGFVLIRYTSDQDYALYVLVQSTLLLIISMHNSYLMGPLTILTPRLAPDERRQTLGSMKGVQRRLLLICAVPLLLLTLAGYLSGLLSGPLASVVAAAIFAIWTALRREYLRSVLLMYSRPHSLLGADAVYATALLAGVAAAIIIHKAVVVGAILALAIAAWSGGAAAHRSLALDPGWQRERAISMWPAIRSLGAWALLGSTIYWTLGQSYSYLLATRLGLTAVADVNATRLLLMPVAVLTIGIVSLLGPSAATWYTQIGIRGVVRRLLMFLVAVGVLDLIYFVAVWWSRDWLMGGVLHKHIHSFDLLLILWTAVVIVGLFRDVLQCALIAMGHYKSLAGQVGVSAAVAVVLMWYGIGWWGAPAVLIGQIVGELINLMGIIILLRKNMRFSLAPAPG